TIAACVGILAARDATAAGALDPEPGSGPTPAQVLLGRDGSVQRLGIAALAGSPPRERDGAVKFIGAILFGLLAGRPQPARAEDPNSMARVAGWNALVPQALDDLIARALAGPGPAGIQGLDALRSALAA